VPMTIFKRIAGLSLTWLLLMQPAHAQSAQQLLEEMQKALELAQPQLQFTRTPPLPAPVFIPENGVLKNYLLGVGDGIEIHLWNSRIQLQYNLSVSPDGKIMIPKLGIISVMGLETKELESQLTGLLKQHYSDPIKVRVMLSRVRPVQVLVTGYIQNPGFYQVPWGTRLLEVLRRAGGVQDQGSVRRIQIHTVKQDQEADLYRFQYAGKLADNPAFFGEETIHIPKIASKVALTGQFRQPGLYEFLPGEHFSQIMNLTGGTKPTGDPDGLLLWENGLNGSQKELKTLTLNQDYKLEDGDILHLPIRKLPVEEKNLTIYGQVQQPGIQAYRRGMTVQDCLRQAGGPLASADLASVRISRVQANNTRAITELNLQDWMQGKNKHGDEALFPGDIVYIPETFFSVKNVMELTTLVVGALGIVSVVINLSRSSP
jgi:protein involved in polysaccharide export with SLBB domain